jgi:hypothetical protein
MPATHLSIKNILTSAILFLCSTGLGQKSAGEYLEVIGKEFSEIQSKTWDYTRSVAHGKSARKVEKNRKEVVLATTAAIRKISALKPHDGDNRLRDSAISFLKVNYAVLNEDYAKLMDLEEIAEQSYDHMEAYMLAREKANDKLHEAGEMVDKEYSAFAERNNIQLITENNKLSKNMEIAGKVYDHYNEVYLVFFKSYKQEAYLLSAMDKNDVNGMEQNRSALAKYAVEGRAKLKTFTPYEKDNSISKACEEMLDFYSEESEKKFADVSAFFVAKDNFEKMKKSFEEKPAGKRTQADVDSYNKAVNDYNAASDAFNKINAELNNRRSALIVNWNKTCDRFTDKHVPKR